MNQTYDEKVVSTDVNKLNVGGKKDTADYEPVCVFTENKPRKAFLRGAKKIVFLVDGAVSALKFKESDTTLNPFWTKKESRAFVHKQVAEAHQEVKIIKTWQFVMLLILLVVVIILQLRTMGAIRF